MDFVMLANAACKALPTVSGEKDSKGVLPVEIMSRAYRYPILCLEHLGCGENDTEKSPSSNVNGRVKGTCVRYYAANTPPTKL